MTAITSTSSTSSSATQATTATQQTTPTQPAAPPPPPPAAAAPPVRPVDPDVIQNLAQRAGSLPFGAAIARGLAALQERAKVQLEHRTQEIMDKYGLGSKSSSSQLYESVQKGEKVSPEAEAAKWKELEGQGFDRSKFDGKAYLDKNPDVAKHWKTDSGLIDPELAAATHYQEWGRHEDREFTTKQTAATPATSEVKAGQPVDFNKMTQEQQYDYLHDLTVARAGGDASAWKTGDKELNLVGVRSFSDGKANAGEADKFNDTVYACRVVDGQKQVQAFQATVDAGKWEDAAGKGYDVKDRNGQSYGTANLADGHYRDAWARGSVSGSDEGLRQVGWVRVHGDRNTDGVVDGNERVGLHGRGVVGGADLQMQFHPAGGDRVGEGSAGCQAIHSSQWEQFQGLLRDAPASQRTFSYTLVDGKQLDSRADGAGGGALFDKAGYDRINMWNEANSAGVSRLYEYEVAARGRGVPMEPSYDGRVSAVSSDSDDGIGIVRTPIKK